VVITIYRDRSFSFEMKTAAGLNFLKRRRALQAGSKTPGREPRPGDPVTKAPGAQ
jgi:ribosomal protein L11